MRRFILELSAEEPLVLTDGSSETMAHRTLGYIPGRMLLGAMAGAWLNNNRGRDGRPDDQPDFRALFLDGSVSWGHAYPWLDGRQTLPAPHCWHKVKNTPDLPRAGDENGQTATVVNLLRWEGTPEELQKELGYQEPPKLKKMPPGFMHPVTFHRPDHLEQWTMHAALERTGRKAADGLLFGFSALAPGARLDSEILARDEAAEALEKLLAQVKTLRVGHARSAGYGLIRVEGFRAEPENSSPAEEKIKPGRHNLYLVSDYLPGRSWLNLYESLKEELNPWLGRVKLESIFAAPVEIAGFNNLWRLPMTARLAWAKGGAFKLRIDGPINPAARPWSLGGGQLEGYGRFLINPAFLEKPFPEAGAPPHLETSASADPGRPLTGPAADILKLLRRRALARETRRLAAGLLAGEKVKNFIRTAAKAPISQSQRGNLRRLVTDMPPEEWVPIFQKKMLGKKTIQEKWRRGIAKDPFNEALKEHLDAIMKKFLGPELMAKLGADLNPELPGGQALDQEEKNEFDAGFRRAFLLALLAAWEKEFRMGEARS